MESLPESPESVLLTGGFVYLFIRSNFCKHTSPQQALKQKTDALWFDVELRYALLSHLPQLRTRKEIQAEVETNQKLLTQQRRDDDMCLQTRWIYGLRPQIQAFK